MESFLVKSGFGCKHIIKNNTHNIYTIYKQNAEQIFIGGYQGESSVDQQYNIALTWFNTLTSIEH